MSELDDLIAQQERDMRFGRYQPREPIVVGPLVDSEFRTPLNRVRAPRLRMRSRDEENAVRRLRYREKRRRAGLGGRRRCDEESHVRAVALDGTTYCRTCKNARNRVNQKRYYEKWQEEPAT